MDAGRRQGHLAKPARAVTPLALRFLAPMTVQAIFGYGYSIPTVPPEAHRVSAPVAPRQYEHLAAALLLTIARERFHRRLDPGVDADAVGEMHDQ